MTGLIRRWTFLTSVVAASTDALHDSLGRLLDGHGFKGLSSSTWAGSLQVRFAEAPLGPLGCRLLAVLGNPSGGRPGGDVLGALDFVRMAVLIDLFRERVVR